MDKRPIEDLMNATLENIREMVDVNTIIGEPVNTPDGSTVIPLSRVCFGFVAGGGEYACPAERKAEPASDDRPFAGGTGAGVTLQPMGFLVLSQDNVRLIPAQVYTPIDRVIEMVPQLLCELKNAIAGKREAKEKAQSAAPEAADID